jgi:hypothetical protein
LLPRNYLFCHAHLRTRPHKGFAEPVRCYKVLGIYDDLVSEGTVIREEADGFKFLLDLKKRGRSRRSRRS